MDDRPHPALLPAGFADLLPPDAQIEADVILHLMATLAGHGYQRVKAPLVEFEASLLSGAGAAMAPRTFRMMDPISQSMIGVRADITPQIARIATTRLINAQRPLRLSYSDQALRVRGSQLHPERQVGQLGAELVGSDAAAADAEIIALAAEALGTAGVENLSADLTLPALVPELLRHHAVPQTIADAAREALDSKDGAAVAAIGGPVAALLGQLMAAAGPADAALAALSAVKLPQAVTSEIERLRQVIGLVRQMAPGLEITVDPVENRGFEYHTGISFTFFARGLRGELGRGGRYVAQSGETTEPATGFTLYTESVVRAVPPPPPLRRIYLPFATPIETAASLRRDGWATIAALIPEADTKLEAQRLACDHFYDGTGAVPL